jgi:phosphohistidine phosphatase
MANPILIIMRHAKANLDSPAGDDFGRSLTDRGKQDAARMGQWLQANFPGIVRVISSPAERTRETVAAVMESWCGAAAVPEVRWDPALYLAELPTLLRAIESEPASPLLLVGHNSGLEDLVWHLLGGEGEAFKAPKVMPTAAVYAVALPARGAPTVSGGARLLAHMRPARLVQQSP